MIYEYDTLRPTLLCISMSAFDIPDRSNYASQRLNDAQRRSFYALYIVWSSRKLPAVNKQGKRTAADIIL